MRFSGCSRQESAIFLLKFTKPGRSLLVQPCTSPLAAQTKVIKNGFCHHPRGDDDIDASRDSSTCKLRLLGEVPYAVQPLAQLAAASRCGLESWRPWLVSAACDGLR